MSVHDGATAAVELAAGLGAMLGCALPLCVAPGVRAARRGLYARLSHERPASDSTPTTAAERPSGPRPRRAPSWAHTDPDNYEDAA